MQHAVNRRRSFGISHASRDFDVVIDKNFAKTHYAGLPRNNISQLYRAPFPPPPAGNRVCRCLTFDYVETIHGVNKVSTWTR